MKKEIAVFSLASILTVPVWLSATTPIQAEAASEMTSAQKVKNVKAKIKAIDAKKVNYATKTKEAYNAYTKLTAKEKKQITNYKTLNKHVLATKPTRAVITKIAAIDAKATTYATKTAEAYTAYKALKTAQKKQVVNYDTLKKHYKATAAARAVITQINALNSKKANFVVKTTAANTAYKKLSTKNRKLVTNAKVLTKNVTLATRYKTAANTVKQQINALTVKNYISNVATVEKSYQALEVPAKALLTQSTIDTLTSFTKVATTQQNLTKLKVLSDDALPDSTITYNGALVEVSTITNINGDALNGAGADISKFINTYNSLDKKQKSFLQGSQEAIDYLLQLDKLVKATTKLETSYEKLDAKSLKKSVQFINEYKKAAETDLKKYGLKLTESDPISLIVPYKENGIDNVVEVEFDYYSNVKVADVAKVEAQYATQINAANDFEKSVENLEQNVIDYYEKQDSGLDAADIYSEIETVIAKYKKISSSEKNPPIDIVSKEAIATYKKYANIPTVVAKVNALTEYAEETPIEKSDVTTLTDAYKLYNALPKNGKAIVQEELSSTDNLQYLAEEKLFTAGQKIDKAYMTAVEKKDLKALVAVNEMYAALLEGNRTKYYIVYYEKIADIPTIYDTQIGHVEDFEKAVAAATTLDKIKALEASYKKVVADKPSGVDLISKETLTRYNQLLNVLEIQHLYSKISTSTKPTLRDLNYITQIIALNKKLAKDVKELVITIAPKVQTYVEEEGNIKEAQNINTQYLTLKPATKEYTAAVKKLLDDYTNANEITKKYVSYDISKAATTAYTKAEATAKLFVDAVNALNSYSTITNIKDVESMYNSKIKPDKAVSNLVDKDVLTTYKTYVPTVEAYNLINALKTTPVTVKQRTDIVSAIKNYNSLGLTQRQIIYRSNIPDAKLALLKDETAINEAVKIDNAYDKIGVNPPDAELAFLKVYELYDAANDTVKNYVIHKQDFIDGGKRYKNDLSAVATFVKNLNTLSRQSDVPDVAAVVSEYKTNIEPYELRLALLEKPTKTLYQKFADIILIQDVASYFYNKVAMDDAESSKYNNWFFEESKSIEEVQDAITGETTDISLYDLGFIKDAIKANKAFHNMEGTQMAIINEAPNHTDYYGPERDKNGNDIVQQDGNGASYIPQITIKNKYTVAEVIYPTNSWLNGTQYQYIVDAEKYDERYEKLDPKNKNYIKDAIQLYKDYAKEPYALRKYVTHTPEIEKFDALYSKADEASKAFEDRVKLLNSNSYAMSVPSGSSETSVALVVKAYDGLDDIAKSLVDTSVMRTYNAYAPVIDVYALATTGKVLYDKLAAQKDITTDDVTTALTAVTAYKKLSADPKKILTNAFPSLVAYEKDERAIKAAQTLDKKFEKLDKVKESYPADLELLEKAYANLSDVEKQYVVNGVTLKNGSFEEAKLQRDYFEMIVKNLSMESPYASVELAVEQYDKLSKNAKSLIPTAILTKYNEFAPMIDMKKELEKVATIPTVDFTQPGYEASTEPRPTSFTKYDIEHITKAIEYYTKISADAKTVVLTDAKKNSEIKATTTDANKDKVIGYRIVLPTTVDGVTTYEQAHTYDYNKTGIPTDLRDLLTLAADIKAAKAADAKMEKVIVGKSDYTKAWIDAVKSYLGLTKVQKAFVLNTAFVKTYKLDDLKAADTIDTVKTKEQVMQLILDFEQSVRQTRAIDQVVTQSKAEILPEQYEQLLGHMENAQNKFTFLSKTFTIDGQKIKPGDIVDAKILQEYYYYMSAYNVQKALENLSEK